MQRVLKTFVRAARREYFLRLVFLMVALFGAERVRHHYLKKVLKWHGIGFDQTKNGRFLGLNVSKLKKEDLSLMFKTTTQARVSFYLNSSGGSTGSPVQLRQCWNYRDAASAVENWHYEEISKKYHFNIRRLHFWGATRDAKSFPKQTIFRRLFANAKIVDSFRLDERALAEAKSDMIERRPDVVVGYPDSLVWLAENLPIGFCESLHSSFVSSGMPLTEESRVKIEEATERPLFNRYGGREIGGCGFQLPDSGELLMVPPFTHFLEVEEESGHILIEGKGKLLVSVLQNRACPIVRYEIGDVVELLTVRSGRFRGWQAIKSIEGRVSEVVSLLGRSYNPIFFIHAIGVDNHRSDLVRFQVAVTSEKSISVRYLLSGPSDNDQWEDGLRAYLSKEMDPRIQVSFEQVSSMELSQSGKHQYVKDLRKI